LVFRNQGRDSKNEDGDSTFNTSEFLGALFSSALQNSYYPRHDRSLGDTMNRFSGALSSDTIGDLLREFTPDMKRLFHKHALKKILKIEKKLPIPDEDQP
jgi:4-carboxymuconolactone decarboxylase